MCVPRFDALPLSCSLLDLHRGGSFLLAPDRLRHSRQANLEDTGVLVAELRAGTGVVEVTDAFLLEPGTRLEEDCLPAEVNSSRHARVTHGSVALTMSIRPRGGAQPERHTGGWQVACPRQSLKLRLTASRPRIDHHSAPSAPARPSPNASKRAMACYTATCRRSHPTDSTNRKAPSCCAASGTWTTSRGQARVDEASHLFGTLCSYASPLGLFAEQIDPGDHSFLGNFPQALSPRRAPVQRRRPRPRPARRATGTLHACVVSVSAAARSNSEEGPEAPHAPCSAVAYGPVRIQRQTDSYAVEGQSTLVRPRWPVRDGRVSGSGAAAWRRRPAGVRSHAAAAPVAGFPAPPPDRPP